MPEWVFIELLNQALLFDFDLFWFNACYLLEFGTLLLELLKNTFVYFGI